MIGSYTDIERYAVSLVSTVFAKAELATLRILSPVSISKNKTNYFGKKYFIVIYPVTSVGQHYSRLLRGSFQLKSLFSDTGYQAINIHCDSNSQSLKIILMHLLI